MKTQTKNETTILHTLIRARAIGWLMCACTGVGAPMCDAAVQFNGANAYAAMNQSFLGGASVSDFTIEFWVKNKRPETWQQLGAKTEFWKEWGIMLPDGGRISFMHAWPNTYYGITSPEGVIAADRWQHVAIVGRGTLGSIYVDGVLVTNENSLRGEISFNAVATGSAVAGFTLGFRDNTTLPDDGWFMGDLADFRIWDLALSAGQIAAIHATAPATNSSGLRHWIPFSEGNGATFKDIIGGLQGQLFNTTWTSDVPQPPHCTPHKATATATVVNGFVVGATIVDSGCGYTNAPAVLIQGGGGSGATATATVSNGVVAAINIVSAGSGYTDAPTIRIASPPFAPTVSIAVSRVNVTQHVVLGRNYVLESSSNLADWKVTGAQFTADSESIVTEFVVDVTGRFFRLRELP